MTQKLIMFKGLPASGKTTEALSRIEQSNGKTKRVSKDDLRRMLDAGRWSNKNEKFVVQIEDEIIKQALSKGFDVIVDDTNLDPKHERRLRALAEAHDAEFVVDDSFLAVPLEVCIQRDFGRPNAVGRSVILRMFEQYLLGERTKRQEQSQGLPPAYIVDIDGTLALLNGRNPYNQVECENDLPNEHVVRLVQTLHAQGFKIVLVSGRWDTYRPQTENWLAKHRIPFDALYMRAVRDNRPDTVVKKELYQQHIEGKFAVLGVFDDRPSVIRMWRYELALPVFDVGSGVEF